MKKNLLGIILIISAPLLWADTWDEVSKGFGVASQALNFLSQLNQVRQEYATTSEQLQLYGTQVYSQRQDAWNQWNGLVSLLTPEQKQLVLKLNTTSVKDVDDCEKIYPNISYRVANANEI